MRSQNWPRDSGSTPVVGSSRMSKSGSLISAQQRLSFCFMPPESLPAGRCSNGSRPVAVRSSVMRARRSDCRLAEQTAEEVDVLKHAERGIEVAAESLRHVGDATANGFEVALVAKTLPSKYDDLSALDRAHAGNERQARWTCRRRQARSRPPSLRAEFQSSHCQARSSRRIGAKQPRLARRDRQSLRQLDSADRPARVLRDPCARFQGRVRPSSPAGYIV